MMRRIVLIAFLLGLPVGSQAENMNSQMYFALCSDVPKVTFNAGACVGFVIGAHSTFAYTGVKAPFCEPESGNNQQYAQVWVKYLKDNPQTHHLPAIVTYLDSMARAFPCK